MPCRNSLDGNGIYFLNGLLLLMMPTMEQPRALRICVGNELRKIYGDVLEEPIPPKISSLLHRLDH